MIESALMQLAFKLTLAVLAILATRGVLLWLDQMINGVDFFETLREASPDARTRYYAARFVGACLLVGLVLS